jgi:hypothetical protein
MVPTVIVAVALMLVSVSILFVAGTRHAISIASVVAVFVGLPLVLEFRRAITISEKEIEYKWRSGQVARINLADIDRVEVAETTYAMFVGRPWFVPGLRVILKSGEVRTFPIDFPDRAEIIARLRDMISSGGL